MSAAHEERALPPVETQPGVLVHPAADRRLATEHWLLSTLPAAGRDRARAEWRKLGVAMLPLGTLFSAVRIPGHLLVALTASTEAAELDAFLAQALDGGPVICDPHGPRYYALVPASTPRTYREDLDGWREVDVDCLGRDSYLGVPRVDAVTCDPQRKASYWSVPMDSAAMLCRPLLVGRLIGAGRDLVAEELNS